MDINRVPQPQREDDTLEAHYSSLERPHACIGGVVFIGRLVEEDSEEVEVFETVPCRRCSGDERH